MFLIAVTESGERLKFDVDKTVFFAESDNGLQPLELNRMGWFISQEYLDCVIGPERSVLKSKRSRVAEQVSRMKIGEVRIVNYGERVDLFRMNLSSFANEKDRKFKTKMNIHDELIVKRIK